MNPGKARETKRLYEFGAFRLDPAERVLAHKGRRIPLVPKAFETLLILIQHSGRVLTKDQLIQTLWPDSFVEENNLTQHISALRRVLGQDPAEQEYIETVLKFAKLTMILPLRSEQAKARWSFQDARAPASSCAKNEKKRNFRTSQCQRQ